MTLLVNGLPLIAIIGFDLFVEANAGGRWQAMGFAIQGQSS